MSQLETKKTGPLFWILGALFLIWNGFGCYIYYIDQTLPDAKHAEMYGEALTALRDAYPTWSVAAYAVAVWGGLLAAILYLLKKRWAAPLFVISLIAAAISFIWGFTNADYQSAAGGGFWVMPVIVVLLGCLEVWWSRKKIADGTLS
jgi:hypothetical protein